MIIPTGIVLDCQQAIVDCQQAFKHDHTLPEKIFSILKDATPLIAVFSFWLGYRQKERERSSSFYTEVVVNPSVTCIDKFFDSYRNQLVEHARQVQPRNSRETTPRDLTKLLTRFSQDLYGLKDNIVKRLEVFDEKAVRRVENIVTKLETDVTMWFAGWCKAPAEPEELSRTFATAKRGLMKNIYMGKFRLLR
jgi:hypothetical protein